MAADFIELLRTCTAEERKGIAMQIPGHKYVEWNVDEYPNMFDDCFRSPQYEKGDTTYAMIHPDQPYDDDSMLLRWSLKKETWTMSFACMGCPFSEGKPILEEDDSCERAGLTLLAHFGLMERRSEFHPVKLSYLSPYKFSQLANENR